MRTLKELIKYVYERSEHYQFLKIKEEWEKQNITIDEQQKDITKLIRKNNTLKRELENEKGIKNEIITASQETIEEKNKAINKLELINLKLNEKLKEKEKARRKLAGKIGGYQKQINKLEMQVEFLKTNRRSPSLEELKDYELKRKRSVNNE